MSIQKFIKENFVLAVGIALPVLLIAVFLVASVVPRHFATPPQYDVLFSTYEYRPQASSPGYDYELAVQDGTLKIKAWRQQGAQSYHSTAGRRLFAFDARTNTVREIHFALPTIAEEELAEKSVNVTVKETEKLKIDTAPTAPDGYTYESGRYGGGGIVVDVFGGGRRNHGARLKQGAVSYKIPDANRTYYYSDMMFIGWIKPE